MSSINFHGLIPAIATPFLPDMSIDEADLRQFATWLGRQEGVVALMTNGRAGEVFSLTPRDRAEVTRIAAEATNGICPVVSSVVCEGIKDAVEQALWAKDAGAAALDLSRHVAPGFVSDFAPATFCTEYFTNGEATGSPLICHVCLRDEGLVFLGVIGNACAVALRACV